MESYNIIIIFSFKKIHVKTLKKKISYNLLKISYKCFLLQEINLINMVLFVTTQWI